MKTYIDPEGKVHYSKPSVIIIGNRQYIPVSDERLIEAGWSINEEEEETQSSSVDYEPTYEELVVQHIRERYTIDDELAILRQRDSKPEEFADYNTYCESCKSLARLEVRHE